MSPTAASAREFALPDLGEGLEDAVLVEWHIDVGDLIGLNQPLCTVETEKATVEIPSPYAGRVVERVGDPGETVAVGAVLVRIADATVDGVAPHTPTSADPPTAGADERTPTLVGYGPDVAPRARRRRSPAAAAPSIVAAQAGQRPRAKPPVRKRARELGIDLESLAPGSGPNATITRADVERAAGVATYAAPSVRAVPTPSDPAARPGDRIPVQGIRARIAERMTVSRSSIPDASCAVDVDCERIVALRGAVRDVVCARAGADVLTPFVLVLRALVLALEAHPILNATLEDDGASIRVHPEVHLGIGVDTPAGLLVAVVHRASELSLVDLALEVRRLVEGARDGTLALSELTGSTFTVSNYGSFGLDEGYPVINHPEAAIVGVGAIRKRPVVVDGAVAARWTATFSCCFDHRICDGSDAGRFLSTLRELVELPEQLLL